MNEKPADFTPLWMLLSAALGFLAGKAYGDTRRNRTCLQQTHDQLRDRLEEARPEPDFQQLQRAVEELRGIVNDIHKHQLDVSELLAVTKGLEKRPS